MALMVIAIVAWVLVVGFAVTDGWDGFDKFWYGLIAFIFGGLFIGLVWLGLELFLGSILPHTLVYDTKPLAALQDSNHISGSFFLGFGQIDSKPTYSYYVASNGGSRLQSVSADKIDVYQDTDKPYVKVASDCTSHWQWLALCNSGMTNTSDDKYDVVEIHVPKGTIQNNYVLDAK